MHSLEEVDGASPYDGLVQGTDGNFYGTTYAGGSTNDGTVFKITPQGTLTSLYSFCPMLLTCVDGAHPYGGVIQATDGNFYGTTYVGGAAGFGSVFKVTSEGTLTTVYSFCTAHTCVTGAQPFAGLVQGTDGNLYGTTAMGGTGCGSLGCGTIFSLTFGGALTTLHDFDLTDGGGPAAPLDQVTDGTFYGTSQYGGTNNSCFGGCGTAYSLTVSLSPFVKTVPTATKVERAVIVLGTNLKAASEVTFNGTAAVYTTESNFAIRATVPTGATTGPVQVVTPSGMLTSNVNFRVEP